MRKLLAIILTLFSFASKAQVLDSLALDTAHLYTSLEEALKEPDKVYKLQLKKKKYDKIPAEVFSFRNLNVLDMRKNRLTQLPKELIQLPYLQEFNFERNTITKLPPEIGQMKNLRVIHIGQNEIRELPDEIKGAEKLEILDLWANNLTELPDALNKMPKLRIVDMRVIQMNQAQQDALSTQFPSLKFYFSNACNCD